LLLPLLRADFALCETYRYMPDLPLRCPLTVFGGLGDKDVSRESLNAWRKEVSGRSFLFTERADLSITGSFP
jgi:medium-chain acyl-[acyl-carrier-protein] hydrolase